MTAGSTVSPMRRWRRSRCKSRTRRSGWGSATPTRSAVPPRSPMAGWVRAGRRSRNLARRELLRWFTEVYRNPPGTDASGIHGTPEQVKERLEEVIAMGANHLLLNPVSRYGEQLEAIAEVVGLK